MNTPAENASCVFMAFLFFHNYEERKVRLSSQQKGPLSVLITLVEQIHEFALQG